MIGSSSSVPQRLKPFLQSGNVLSVSLPLSRVTQAWLSVAATRGAASPASEGWHFCARDGRTPKRPLSVHGVLGVAFCVQGKVERYCLVSPLRAFISISATRASSTAVCCTPRRPTCRVVSTVCTELDVAMPNYCVSAQLPTAD